MLIGASSHTYIQTAKIYSYNRKLIVLLAIGGASFAAATIWMYRRKSNRNSQQKEQNRRKESFKSRSMSEERRNCDKVNSTKPTIDQAKQIEEDTQEENGKDTMAETSILNVQKLKEFDEYTCENNTNKETESGQIPNMSSQTLILGQQTISIIPEHESELNWAKLVEAEEQKNQIETTIFQQQETQNEIKQNKDSSAEMQTDQEMRNSSTQLYSGRNSAGSIRQHPVNTICTCSRCIETLNDLQSSRGYKNAESPHSTHSEGSADSGRATGPLTSCSPFAVDEFGQPEVLPIYEFEVPNTLVGLIIGIKGKTIKELCARANVRMLIRPHHTANKYDTHQICSIEGRREDINKCLHMIRLRFPPCRFPDLNLKPVFPPPPTTSTTTRGAPSALALSVGVPCEVYISAHVDAGHFFLQMPTHPSFPSLAVLDQFMISVYSQAGGAPEIPKPCNVGVLCAAPAFNGWFRAITLAYEPEQDETLVRFVDYGGFARLPRTDLRQIRTDFMTLPMQAIECYLANVQPIDGTSHWNEKANELFQQLCITKIIQGSLVGYCKHDGIPCVELHVLDENKKTLRIDQVLLERGLAKPADPPTILARNSLIG